VWLIKRSCKKHNKRNYSYRFDEKVYIEINNQIAHTRNKTGESIFYISAIEEIDETDKHFFVKIKSGEALIIPKHKIQTDELRSEFETLGLKVNEVTCKWK
jgi:chaperonin cofactor prefoldin